VIVALIVMAGALAWVAVGALRSNLEYYKTPTEVLHLGTAAFGDRIRLGGLAEPGSVCARGQTVRFVLTDITTSIRVVTSKGVPQLFAGGRGVIAEGVYGRDRVFHADDILVKHDDAYAPPKTGPIPHAATPACA
jgi:cytochrome c-type biogenesis protein CcmE